MVAGEGGLTAEGNLVLDPSFEVAPQLLGFALGVWRRRTELSDGRGENPRNRRLRQHRIRWHHLESRESHHR